MGRIAAVHNRGHNEFHGDRVGFFGFFECVDDQEAANGLFDAVRHWFADQDIHRFVALEQVNMSAKGEEKRGELAVVMGPFFFVFLMFSIILSTAGKVHFASTRSARAASTMGSGMPRRWAIASALERPGRPMVSL